MKIKKQVKVPTGDIFVVEGHKGDLEVISLGDYGKSVNLNQNKSVPDSAPMIPLQEKWVITISTQYGCSMGCRFCDVPKVGPGKNATLNDLQQQVIVGLQAHKDITWSNRLNIHYARMGEPTWNPYVLDHARWLKRHIDPEYNVHPVVSTMMPKRNEWLKNFIHTWMRIKNRIFYGNAGLQLSINSTNESEREYMFSKNTLPLWEIAKIMKGIVPVGRKITLNFPVCHWEIDPDVLLRYFSPEHYIIKLTPMHETKAANKNNLKTVGDYTTPEPYQDVEKRVKKAGYDCLVFITSHDEDKGMITCGNVILSGRDPDVKRDGDMVFLNKEISRNSWNQNYQESLQA